MLRKYAYPIMCILGLIGNTMSAFVFLSHSLRKYSCSIFLASRSISDNGVLLASFIAWLDFVNIRIFHINVICQITVFLAYFCSFLSVWCVVCVTVDNYVRMCHPSVVGIYCKAKYAVMILSVLVTISMCIYHVPFWSIYITKIRGTDYCLTKEKYYNVQYILTYIDTALTFIMPLAIILICMSLLIFKAVQSHHRRNTNLQRFSTRTWPSSTSHYLKVTKLLFAVSTIFLVLHTPTHIIKMKTVVEALSGDPKEPSVVLRTLNYIFQVMYCLNFAINFLVYYIFGNNFRQVFARHICDISKWHNKLCEKKLQEISISSEMITANTFEIESLL